LKGEKTLYFFFGLLPSHVQKKEKKLSQNSQFCPPLSQKQFTPY